MKGSKVRAKMNNNSPALQFISETLNTNALNMHHFDDEETEHIPLHPTEHQTDNDVGASPDPSAPSDLLLRENGLQVVPTVVVAVGAAHYRLQHHRDIYHLKKRKRLTTINVRTINSKIKKLIKEVKKRDKERKNTQFALDKILVQVEK